MSSAIVYHARTFIALIFAFALHLLLTAGHRRRLAKTGRLMSLLAVALLALAVPLVSVSAGGWVTKARMPTGRTWLAVATGVDGRIYAIGGSPNISAVEAYDPTIDSWTTLSPLPYDVYGAAAATGTDGRIYVTGGAHYGAITSHRLLQIYDPQANSWTLGPDLPEDTWAPATAAGNDGRIYVFGGQWAANKVQIYNPASSSWSLGPNLLNGRIEAAAVKGNDGRIYLMGGLDGLTFSLSSLNIYDPSNNTWTIGASMTQGRANLAGALGPDGRIYAIGGMSDSGGYTYSLGGSFITSVEAYDPATNTWTLAPALPTGRAGMGASQGGDGNIYVVGGVTPSDWGTTINQALVFPLPSPTPPTPTLTPTVTPTPTRGSRSAPDPATWTLILTGSALLGLYTLFARRRSRQ